MAAPLIFFFFFLFFCSLESSHREISRTRTHELSMRGTGFTNAFPPLIVFDPHIDRDDYVVHVSPPFFSVCALCAFCLLFFVFALIAFFFLW